MLRTRLLSSLLTAAAPLLVFSCEPAPDYPVEPSIEFKSMRAERVDKPAPETDVNEIFVTITYKDGDGDLGLAAEDLNSPPYNAPPYNFNYYAKMYVFNSRTNQFVEDLSFNGTFARMLAADAKAQPIRGELTYNINKGNGFPINYPQYAPGNKVKFDIYIYDRAKNKSNVITTEEYVLP
ncbi:hypothetical protein LJ737_18745 [Hymenobacter sp. 15J16-1T3B]|uniref:hypothetical protein n=1 Tax=Hymenobacter sp. 15J16-1T3B TaxID=2886941 RepID=UPI001D100AF0|nr:hypothetical protein [Hymenobacter sp. 15J16-1T3B]MCC3159288.1 hypothetical protein [Hymenobacter sp. 15J16-1T3B]